MKCAICGWNLNSGNWGYHWKNKHPDDKGDHEKVLVEGEMPRQGYWWCMKKNRNETKPAVYNGCWSGIKEHVASQLKAGVKIPYYWMEFGKQRMDEHFLLFDDAVMNNRTMANMRNPTRKEREKYRAQREKYETMPSEEKVMAKYPMIFKQEPYEEGEELEEMEDTRDPRVRVIGGVSMPMVHEGANMAAYLCRKYNSRKNSLTF